MKQRSFNIAVLAASLLAVAGPDHVASAHTLSPAVVGNGPEKLDVYEVTCFDAKDGTGEPIRLAGQVRGIGPKSSARAMMTIENEKGSATVSTVDWKTGDKGYSPEISNDGGLEVHKYRITISKTAKPGKPEKAKKPKLVYGMVYHCLSAIGHAGTNLVTVENN